MNSWELIQELYSKSQEYFRLSKGLSYEDTKVFKEDELKLADLFYKRVQELYLLGQQINEIVKQK